MLAHLAWRNVWRNRTRSLLTAATIAFSITFVMGGLSFLNGFSAGIEEDVLVKTGHVRVVHKRYVRKQHLLSLRSNIKNSAQIAEKISSLPHIREVREKLTFGASIDVDGEHQYPIIINGFAAEQEFLMTRFKRALQAGSLDGLSGKVGKTEGRLILGIEAAATLEGASPGTEVVVMATSREGSLCGRDFKVAAIVDLANPYLNMMAFSPLPDVRDMLRMEGRATDITVFSKRPNQLEELVRQIEQLIDPEKLAVQPWYEVGGIGDFINVHYRLASFIAMVILFVAAVCVSNTMIMALLERTKEMGVLAALGFSRFQVRKLFFLETFLLACIGAIPGTIFGLALSYYFEVNGIYWGRFTDFPMRTVAYGHFEIAILFWAVGLGIVVAMLASIGPVLRGTKLKPSDALRHK